LDGVTVFEEEKQTNQTQWIGLKDSVAPVSAQLEGGTVEEVLCIYLVLVLLRLEGICQL